MCFGCSKEPSHRDGSFEYPKHIFWLRNKKNNFTVRHSYLGACYYHDYKNMKIKFFFFRLIPLLGIWRNKRYNYSVGWMGKMLKYNIFGMAFQSLIKIKDIASTMCLLTCYQPSSVMYILSTYSDIVHKSYIIHCYTIILFPWQLSVDYFFCRKSFLPGIVSQNLIKMFNINNCFSDSFISQYSYSYISLPTRLKVCSFGFVRNHTPFNAFFV